MKVSLYTITLNGGYYRGDPVPLMEIFPLAKQWGYDGIEIEGKRPHGSPLDLGKMERDSITEVEPLLVEILREGNLIAELPPIETFRERRDADVERLDPGVRRLMNPHIYHVSLSDDLWKMKQELIASTFKPVQA